MACGDTSLVCFVGVGVDTDSDVVLDVDINDFYCLTKKFCPLLLGISGGLVVNINKTHLCPTCNYP